MDTDVYNAYRISVDAAERARLRRRPPISYGYNEGEVRFPGDGLHKAGRVHRLRLRRLPQPSAPRLR